MARGTTLRSVRVPDEIWQPAQEQAERTGESVSDVIRRALVEYVTPPPGNEN